MPTPKTAKTTKTAETAKKSSSKVKVKLTRNAYGRYRMTGGPGAQVTVSADVAEDMKANGYAE